MNSLVGFYKSIFSFKGRTSRKDYWISILIYSIWLVVLTLPLSGFVGPGDGPSSALEDFGSYGLLVAIIAGFISLHILLIVIRLQTIYFRRMRDAGQTNTISIVLFILNLIPYVQVLTRIYTIYLLLKPSKKFDSI